MKRKKAVAAETSPHQDIVDAHLAKGSHEFTQSIIGSIDRVLDGRYTLNLGITLDAEDWLDLGLVAFTRKRTMGEAIALVLNGTDVLSFRIINEPPSRTEGGAE